MRRALVALTLSLSILVSCSPAAGATPTPPTTTTATSTPTTARPTGVDVWWWRLMARRQADADRRARAAFYAAALVEAAKRSYPAGQCGGDLPPCYVMRRESRGIITARNPRSTASGKWQFLRSTWAGFGGYRDAYLAPERVQDDRARQLWNHGRGCSHWSAC